ncbi:MAG: hypothetical protein GXY76_00390 [Chloroflexi bacterium]|mgnify:CR=1 FL=1|nr:hypothetical protein [Chloroflexota bacterium]
MPEYLHPGVYIEEQPAPQTIEGVSTSTAGFVGVAAKGPTEGLPALVTSMADFVRLYGGYLSEEVWGDHRFLAYAVDGFFTNGGQRAYIKRVVGPNAARAALTLNDGFVTRLLEDTASNLAGRNKARLASLRGIAKGTLLSFEETIAGTLEVRVAQVTAYDAATGTVTLNAPLALRYTKAGCEVFISGVADAPKPSAGAASLKVEASSEGIWARGLRVSANDMDGAASLAEAAGVATALTATSLAFAANGPAAAATTATLDAPSQAKLENGDEVEFALGAHRERRAITKAGANITWADALLHGYDAAGSTVVRITALRAGAVNPAVAVENSAGFAAGDLARVIRGAETQLVKVGAVGGPTEITLDTATRPIAHTFAAGDGFAQATAGRSGSLALDLRSASNFYPGAVIEIDDGARKAYHRVAGIAGRALQLASALGADVASGAAVRVVEFSLSASDGAASETFANLSLDPAADNYAVKVVNAQSRLIRLTNQGSTRTIPFNLPRTTHGAPQSLAGGHDGDIPTPADYAGVDGGPGQRTGIKALADIDSISIIAAPGVSDSSVQGALISQCEELKDRFAVLDPARGSVIGSGQENDVLVQRGSHDTFYAALYYPWLRIADPLYPRDREGRLVPPSGHVIGIYARVDAAVGVHKAPANEVVRGISALEFKLNDREQDVLNPRNISVLRDFRDSNRGIRVWGSRCLTSDSGWKYVPVRRLFIFIEESLDEGLQWVVFEPNGENLWARVRRTISGFLRTLWLNGQLRGVTQEEAFFVRCDRTTMTEDDIASGRLICLVGVAPLHPAEFVIIRIGQKTLEAQE